MAKYCGHYHIDRGVGVCWACADRQRKANRYLSIGVLLDLARLCGCEGNKERCDFKKVGENLNERL